MTRPAKSSKGAVSERARARSRRNWLLAYEHRRHPVLPLPAFLGRLLVSLAMGLTVVGGSLAFGMWGYHSLEGRDGIDSFINAAMILSGMGPLWSPQTEAGKLFAGFYALYSGMAVLVIAGLLFAPLLHRLLHRFLADDGSDDDNP